MNIECWQNCSLVLEFQSDTSSNRRKMAILLDHFDIKLLQKGYYCSLDPSLILFSNGFLKGEWGSQISQRLGYWNHMSCIRLIYTLEFKYVEAIRSTSLPELFHLFPLKLNSAQCFSTQVNVDFWPKAKGNSFQSSGAWFSVLEGK